MHHVMHHAMHHVMHHVMQHVMHHVMQHVRYGEISRMEVEQVGAFCILYCNRVDQQ